MNSRLERGTVAAVLEHELVVEVNGELERAFPDPALLDQPEVGDTVLLNTTAVRLGLGTGGVHFVVSIEGKSPSTARSGDGHIMKLRYTPHQFAVHAVEEQSHPMHEVMREAEFLENTPVVICELHSMIPAVAMSFHHEMIAEEQATQPRVVYVMTDGGALPMHFSKTIAALKEHGLLTATVTVGHAYGGDLEAVNLYSGLLAAKHVLHADIILCGMGPGIVGTGTRYGHTGIEVGQAVNAVHALAGEAVVVPRISFADARERHRGLSHHTITALGRVALAQATLPLPNLDDDQAATVWKQITESGLHLKHRLVGLSGSSILDAAPRFPVPLRTMGRTLDEDPAFFLAAGAAGEWAARQKKRPTKRKLSGSSWQQVHSAPKIVEA
ncbi:DUF3866 family protein [Tumebacillus permanentifrigoris]|uniref:Uncharacterized protein DUF3866 n=1 Tax=Tumebacillus permanentifrigoris TaxID=378543 RepID=A0A316DBQ9_9BACL|nr:DUF3866 family protein [Tumebacillus permanentifrigoris]PWK14522.1 uncharacterized protein DUF3866 [Tumebacillus permanentifrigoris]